MSNWALPQIMLEHVLETAPTFIHILRGKDLIFEYANAAYLQLVGRSDIVGRPAFEAMPEATDGGYPAIIAGVMATRKAFHGHELDVTLARGSAQAIEKRIIDVVYEPLLEADGSCNRVVGYGTDVTEHVLARRRAEVLEKSAHDRFLQALKLAKMAWWDWEPQTGKLAVSETMAELYRMPIPPANNIAYWQSAVHASHREAHVEMVRKAGSDLESWQVEFRLLDSENEEVWLEERAYAVVGEDGQPQRLFGLVWDVSDRKKGEMVLREADRRKSNFLATLAHELRNPMATIKNGLEILRFKFGDADRVQSLRELMHRQMEQLVHLVDDLLDMSRINLGKVVIRHEPLLLGSVLSTAVETIWPKVEEKNIQLRFSPGSPISMVGDRDRLSQVFTNLLSNAVKFTPDYGSIEIAVNRIGQEVIVTVTDTGIGIPLSLQPIIFEMFSQAPGQHATGGLGIGLSLVKQLVELHGGRVSVQSDGAGNGSIFEVVLPLTSADNFHTPEQQKERSVITTTRVLIVDDNKDAADTLAENLRLRGHEICVAYSGSEALGKFVTFTPEVVVLDIGMPEIDGYEVAKRIRSQLNSRSVLLVALTGWGQQEDKARAFESGFDKHFTKPLDFNDLMIECRL